MGIASELQFDAEPKSVYPASPFGYVVDKMTWETSAGKTVEPIRRVAQADHISDKPTEKICHEHLGRVVLGREVLRALVQALCGEPKVVAKWATSVTPSPKNKVLADVIRLNSPHSLRNYQRPL